MTAEWKTDKDGNQIHMKNINDLELLKDDVVLSLAEIATFLSDFLSEFKLDCAQSIETIISLAADKYKKTLGGGKGNVTIYSFDGRYKVTRDIGNRSDYDEKILIAQELISECAVDWIEGSRSEAIALAQMAFKPNRNGKLDDGRLRSLEKIESEDTRWNQAMQAIKDSRISLGKTTYYRIYVKQSDGSYKQIPLDLAGV